MPVSNSPRLEVLDESSSQGRFRAINFTGAGVTATASGDTATINIPGGGGGSFSNTVLTATPSTDQQDWSIVGRLAYSTVNMTPAANAFIGGVAGGAGGDVLVLRNASNWLVWLVDEDVSSTAGNRLSLNRAGTFLLPGESASFFYDVTSARWVETAVSLDMFQTDDKTVLILPNTTTSVVSIGRGATSNTATLSTNNPAATPTDSFQEDPNTQITNAVANGSSDVRGNGLYWQRGPTAGRQGIYSNARVRFTALGATGGVWVGAASSTAAITTQPRNTNNTFGLGAHGGETTLRVWCRDAAAANAVDLGANFPVPSATAAYEVAFLAVPGQAVMQYMVRRLDANFRASGTLSTNVPTNTLGFSPRANVMVGATAAANTAQFTRMLMRALS